jgi:hypothetical protein
MASEKRASGSVNFFYSDPDPNPWIRTLDYGSGYGYGSGSCYFHQILSFFQDAKKKMFLKFVCHLQSVKVLEAGASLNQVG